MSRSVSTISRSVARRYALRAQRLDRTPRPRALTRADIARTVAAMGVLQIDSVNVLARAHLMPLYSRLGAYDPQLLADAAGTAPRLLLEQWGHEACFVTPQVHRLLAAFTRRWASGHAILTHAGADALTERILAELARGGPATSSELSARLAAHDLSDEESALGATDSGADWNRGAVKILLENLFDDDRVAAAGRTAHFHRIYDVSARVLPPAVRDVAPPDRAEAIAQLTAASISAIGIGDVRAIADVYRLPVRSVASVLERLVAAETVSPVSVEGIARPYYLDAALTRPRRATHVTFLSPFDPLIFFRPRALELFDLDYRIGIYTPKDKRTRGYYSLPLLVGEHIVARADLAHNRATGSLEVRGAWDEPDRAIPLAEVDAAASAALERLAAWLGASEVSIPHDAPGEAAARWARARH